MFHLIKSVITAGDFKLADIRHKINKFYLLGNITEAEMDQLLALAGCNVSVDAERPDYMVIIQSIAAKVAVLDTRVKVLEGIEEEGDAHPTWKPWDGISKDYAYGEIVTHNSKLWESFFQGQNVWEPGTVGQQFWIPFLK